MAKKKMTVEEMARKGGKARMAKLSKEERKAFARSGGIGKAAKRKDSE